MKNYLKKTFKKNDEWLNNRGIGGSDAAAICGKSKWQTANDVYNRLVFKQEKKIESEVMNKGKKAETHIRKLFMLDHPKYKVTEPPKNGAWLFARRDEPLITCTPDGIFKSDEGKYGLEIKYCDLIKREIRDLWENNTLPMQYYFQCLQYMLVIGDLDGVCLYAHLKYYKYNEETRTFDFEHSEQREFWVFRKDSEKHLKYLEKKEMTFIEENVKKRKRPITIIEM